MCHRQHTHTNLEYEGSATDRIYDVGMTRAGLYTSHTIRPPRKTYRIRGIDGLRALGAIFVLIYHLVPAYGGAGVVGVDVFFTISGFLITALLMKEYDATGRINLRHFWIRRLRRLVPAVTVMVLVVVGLARLISDDAVVQVRWQSLGALTGTYNWLQIAHSSSYFEAQSPMLLTNMWSLAIEQQIYIVWPVVVIGLLAWAGMRGRNAAAFAIGAASVLAHIALLGADVTRSYVGTDTHIFGLMIGAMIAFSVPGIMTSDQDGRSGARRPSSVWGLIAWTALAGLIALVFTAEVGRWFYPWGLLVASALTALLIRGILPDVPGRASDALASLLESAPLVWIGQRSYGIYLWHWPLYVLASYHLHIPSPTAEIGVVALSVLAAHISFEAVETPIRTHGLAGTLQQVRTWRTTFLAGGALATLAILGLFTTAVVTSQPLTEAQRSVMAGQQALASPPQPSRTTPAPGPTTTPSPTHSPSTPGSSETPNTPKSDTTESPSSASATDAAPTPPPEPINGNDITVIGDSVTLASAPALLETFPGIIVDGEVSRSVYAFTNAANELAAQGQLHDTVVISLGTNGVFPRQTADEMLDYLGPDRKVVFVTAYGPPRASWIPTANDTMRAMAKDHADQVRIADWHAVVSAHPEVLASDQIHPTAAGGKLYAAEVERAITSFNVPDL